MNVWATRAGIVATGTAVVLAFAAVPAQAAEITKSTTGASGRAVYIKNGDWDLFATDTLTDGHCARWQERAPSSSSWSYKGNSICTATEGWAGFARSGYSYRICRTGVGNCSTVATLP
ncbi:hypothetical protein [Micromonospora oryzae]|uniref:hypothetical protein n=1 Tax=Micromonospora sp. DSM 102119 TaxID=3111768 RepID=UPI0031D9A068